MNTKGRVRGASAYERYVQDVRRAISTLLEVTDEAPGVEWEQGQLLGRGRERSGLTEHLVHDALLELILERAIVKDRHGRLLRTG